MKLTELKGGEPFPSARSGHRLVAVADFIVLFGGYTYQPVFGGELKKEIWCYHTLTGSWKLILTDSHDFPSSAASCAVVSCGTKLIVFGGSGVNFGYTNSNSLHILDMETLTWRRMPLSGREIEGGFGHSISLDAERKHVYLYGGCDGFHYFNTMNKICLETWNNENFYRSNHRGIYRHESVNHEEKILIFGGGSPHPQTDLGTIPFFCTETNTWHELRANSRVNPEGRLAHSCTKIKKKVIIMGGQTKKSENSSENCALGDIWLFDLESLSWTELQIVLPQRTFFHSSAKGTDDYIYSFGGSQYGRSGSVQRLNVFYKVSLFVPSLVEIVWSFLSRNLVNDKSEFRRVMHDIGAPSYLIERL